MSEPFYTVVTLAERFAISERTVRDILHRGELPSYRIGGSRRIDPVDVETFLADRREEE